MRARAAILAFVACVALAYVTIAFWIPLFIYRPASLSATAPAAWGVKASAVEFPAGDGVRLTGWWAPPREPDAPTVLIAHGRSGNIAGRAGIMRVLASAGFGVLMFDYRGYGASTGRTPDERALQRDAMAAYDWLVRAGVRKNKLIVLGQSLGDAPAAYVAARRPVALLVLVSPFTSLPGAALDRLPWLSIAPPPWPRNRFDVAASLPHVEAPILFIASRHDGLVPWSNTRRLAMIVPRAHWLRADALRHDGLLAHVAADGRLVAAIDAALGRRGASAPMRRAM